MNSDFSKMSGEERAVRLTAFALGELSPAEMEEVRQVASTDQELARELEQLRQTIELIQETTALDRGVSTEGVPLRMDDERRQKLLKTFKTPAPRRVRRKRELWHVPMSIAAALVGLLVLAAGLPLLTRSKVLAQRMSGLTLNKGGAKDAASPDKSYSWRSDGELSVETVRKRVDFGAQDVRIQIGAEAGTAPSYTLPGGRAVAHGSDVSGSRVVFSDSGLPLPTPPVDRNVSPATAKNTMTVVLPAGTAGNGDLAQADEARPSMNTWDEKKGNEWSGLFFEKRGQSVGGMNAAAAPIIPPANSPVLAFSSTMTDPMKGLKLAGTAGKVTAGKTFGDAATGLGALPPNLEKPKANDLSQESRHREFGSAEIEIPIRYMVTDLDLELARFNQAGRDKPALAIPQSPGVPPAIALQQPGAVFENGLDKTPSPGVRPSPKQDGYNVNVAEVILADGATANSPKGGSVFSLDSVGFANVPPQSPSKPTIHSPNAPSGWFDASTSGQTTPRLENGRPAAEPEQPRPVPADGGNSGGGGRSGLGSSFAQVSITGGGGQGLTPRGPDLDGDAPGRLVAGKNSDVNTAAGDVKNRANIQLPVFGSLFRSIASSDRESSPTRPNVTTAAVRAVNDQVNEDLSGKRPADETITIIPDDIADRLKTGEYVQNGKALLEMGQLSDAEVQLKKAIERDPSDKTAFYYLDLVQGNKYEAEARKRERSSKEMLMLGEKEWQVPNTRDQLDVPNTYARTDLVQTSPNIDPPAAAGPAAIRRNPGADGIPVDTSIVTASTAFATATNAVMAAGNFESSLAIDSRWNSFNGSLAGLADITKAEVKPADPAPVITPLHTRVFRLDPNKFSQGLQNVTEGFFGSGGGGGFNNGVVGQGGPGGGTNGAGGGGIEFVTSVTQLAPKIAAIREFFSSAGVDLSAPNALFFNDRTGVLMVRGTTQDLNMVEKAISTISPGTVQPNEKLPQADPPPAVDPVPAKPIRLAPIPQPEIQTRDNAFSTFSLNVADVSFKLAAASLERGAMPEAASIRSEEFINAFDYRDPLPAAGVPVSFAWERARYPFAQNRDALRFSIKTAAQGRDGGKPLNLVLLLDNSGSMERADRVAIIQESLRTLAAQLKPQDKISVVTFARTATLRVDGATGAQANEVAKKIGALTPEGGTNLEDALDLAYRTALRHYAATAINRVVLLTDGAANLGNLEPKMLQANVEGFRKQGVALDCFGIGWEGFNDDLLEQLSRNGDGRYGFINEPSEAGTEFAAQLAGALQVAASDVKVQVQFNPKRVTTYRQVGYAKHQLTKEQFRDNKVDAAEIGAAEAGNAVYIIETNPHGEGPVATVRVRFRIPQTDNFREHEWVVPFGSAVELEKSSPAMRLAAAATAFSESLASSPYATEVTSSRLLGILSGVPEVYGADPRPKKMEWMVRQAKSISGK